jgi:hypothetical protein
MTGDNPLPPEAAAGVKAPPVTRGGLPTLEALTTGELHLAQPKPAPMPYVEPPVYRPQPPAHRPWGLVLALLALGLGALAVFALKPGLQHSLPTPAGTMGTVLIFSDPDGAQVKIGETVVGVTPFAADNVWPGDVHYEISAPGRQTKRGTFAGGGDAQVKVVLPRLRAK